MALDPSVFLHPNALCESEDVGKGTRVWAFAHVLPGARVGENCNVCDHAFIETGAIVGDRVTIKNNVLLWDRVVVEDDVFLGPNAVFTNDFRPRAHRRKTSAEFAGTCVRRGATIGANATIVCGVTIGHDAFIGAGTVVLADVEPHALVVGNPGRPIGWVCTCGERLPESLRCSCGRAFEVGHKGEGLRTVAGT